MTAILAVWTVCLFLGPPIWLTMALAGTAFIFLQHIDPIIIAQQEVSAANSFTDPTHRHHLGWHSLDYFTGEHEHAYYTRARFRTRRASRTARTVPLESRNPTRLGSRSGRPPSASSSASCSLPPEWRTRRSAS